MNIKITILRERADGNTLNNGTIVFPNGFEIPFQISDQNLAVIHDNHLLNNIQLANGDNVYQDRFRLDRE